MEIFSNNYNKNKSILNSFFQYDNNNKFINNNYKFITIHEEIIICFDLFFLNSLLKNSNDSKDFGYQEEHYDEEKEDDINCSFSY